MNTRLALCLLSCSLFGCQGVEPASDSAASDPTVSEPLSVERSVAPDTALTTPREAPAGDRAERPVRGYLHSVARSSFRLGHSVQRHEEGDLVRWVGSEGVFAVYAPTGEARALPNADAPGLASPIDESPEAHARRVVDYFHGAGLPDDQVGSVRIHVMKQGSGLGSDLPVDERGNLAPGAQGEVRALYAVLTRRVEGIPVVDSVAWASMNTANEVLSEEVRWPEIPRRVVDEAHALEARLRAGDPVAALGRAAPFGGVGHVVIRHATESDGGVRVAFAAYDVDVPTGRGMTVTHHFAPNGEELHLPRELNGAPSDRKP